MGSVPSTMKCFKKKLDINCIWDEVDGTKTNPRIDVPEFFVGGLGFQLDIRPRRFEENKYDLWLKLSEASRQVSADGFDIKAAKILHEFSGATIQDRVEVELTFSNGEAHLISIDRSAGRFIIDMEFVFDDVFPYRLQFLDGVLAAKRLSDCKIILENNEEKPIFVHKTILAMNSPFFQTLFFGEFKEKDEDSVKLSDIKETDFLEYLYCVYPAPNRPLAFKRLETLLRLADRFQNDVLMGSIESFMKETNNDQNIYETQQVLLWADQYQMPELFYETLESIKKEDLKALDPKKCSQFKPSNLELLLKRHSE